MDVVINENREPPIYFYATRDIQRGEELTFDYGLEYWGSDFLRPLPGTDSRDFTDPEELREADAEAWEEFFSART